MLMEDCNSDMLQVIGGLLYFFSCLYMTANKDNN